MTVCRFLLYLSCALSLAAPPAVARESQEETIKSLESKTVQIRPGKVIVDGSDLARENYRAFLNLMSEDPELRAEALRRL